MEANRAIGRRTARTRSIWREAIISVPGYLGVDRVLTVVEAVDPGDREVAHDDHDTARGPRERRYLYEIEGNLDVDLRDEHIQEIDGSLRHNHASQHRNIERSLVLECIQTTVKIADIFTRGLSVNKIFQGSATYQK